MRNYMEIEIARMRRSITKRAMAKQMHMDASLLGRKLKGKTTWQDGEYEKACEIVGLDPFVDPVDQPDDLPSVGSAGSGAVATPRVVYSGPVRQVHIDGHSMSPALEHGWVVSTRRCEWGSVKPGDVVLVTWAQSQEAAFFEAYPRPDGSVRLLKRNPRYAKNERELMPDQVLELVASVATVTGIVRKGARSEVRE
jgi:hypothetical protein